MTSLADMHTHSLHSHDSKCPIEEMVSAQIEKGTRITAVTNHFDTDRYSWYDGFTPIKQCDEEIKALNKKYGNDFLLLSGIEISEGFWHPGVLKKAYEIADFDVIIGSVHQVRYEKYSKAYASCDFSTFSDIEINDFLDRYFDDMLYLLATTDFDILAHLTCPLRYIVGRYKRKVDVSRYQEKITAILKRIIEKGISLEVNTSKYYDVINDFCPSKDIIRQYFELGGRLITLGSDAHLSSNASIYFDKAISTLKTIGFKNIYYYKKRQPVPIKI